jgi:hypothetical protein
LDNLYRSRKGLIRKKPRSEPNEVLESIPKIIGCGDREFFCRNIILRLFYLHGVQGGARASHAFGAQGSGAAFSQAAGFAFSQAGGVQGCGSAFSHAFGSAFSQGAGAAFSHAFGSAFSQGAGAAFSHAFGATFSHGGGVIFSQGATASAFSHAFGAAFSHAATATGSHGPHGVHDRSFLPRIRSNNVRCCFFTLQTASHGSQEAGSQGCTAQASACSQGLTCSHGSQLPATAKELTKQTSDTNRAGNINFFDILQLSLT